LFGKKEKTMNKKGKALFGIFSAVLFCGQGLHATEIGNLTETSVKISEIDMNKDFGQAGIILDTFYTGSVMKGKSETPVVYAAKEPARDAETPPSAVCNAKPSKIALAGKVPPLQSKGEGSKKTAPEIPVQAGALAIGAAALALSSRKNGYLRNYGEDLDTVTDFLVDLVTSDSNPKPPPPNENYDVHPSGGAPTCNGENYCTRP
jgi:hypothetical protein